MANNTQKPTPTILPDVTNPDAKLTGDAKITGAADPYITVQGDVMAITFPKGVAKITAQTVISKQATPEALAAASATSPTYANIVSRERWFQRSRLLAYGYNASDGSLTIVCTVAYMGERTGAKVTGAPLPAIDDNLKAFFKG